MFHSAHPYPGSSYFNQRGGKSWPQLHVFRVARGYVHSAKSCYPCPSKIIVWYKSMATITGSSFATGCMRNLLPGFAPISLQWFSLYVSFSNICKAAIVTHTKRIDRNLLRKETSFVCNTSSVLRKSRHMKQKEKITYCC